MRNAVLIFILMAFMPAESSADKIKKGYQALEIYNYFEAKRLFEASVENHLVPAAYGLSIIYFRDDNPFHNMDSAYNFIVRSVSGFSWLDSKERAKIATYGVDSLAIIQHRDRISAALYQATLLENSVEGFNQFISKNVWSPLVEQAVFKRDSLAYEAAVKKGTSADFQFFLDHYPISHFAEQAQAQLDLTTYLESTASNTLLAYLEFVKMHPESPYKTDAEDKIFEFYTQTGTVEAYRRFITDCPLNHNVNEAWRKLYNTHVETTSYSESSLQEFSSAFPEYPFKNEIESELVLAAKQFYPVKTGMWWGFVDEEGLEVIPPKFEEADFFSEGLAAVKIEGKYGYIGKNGELLIGARFDDALPFQEGHAVVELKGKLGMINRSGEFIIPARYEDLGNLQDGLAYFLGDSLYGYFDSKGIVRLSAEFTQAFDYEAGKAIVSKNNFFGLIDTYGTTYIPMKYDELRPYSKDIYLAMTNDYWGLISLSGDTILPFEYDYVGAMSCNRAIVEKESRFNFIDPSGKLVLAEWLDIYSEYRQLAMYRNGYALIEIEGKYNLIDTTGKKIFTQPKEGLGDYSDLIAVKKAGKWGYYSPGGIMAIPHNFTLAESFRKGYAIAGADPFYGLINKSGAYVLQPFYEELTFLNDTLLIAKSRGIYGLLHVNGDTLLNFGYISIEPISDKVVKIEQGEAVFYYDLVRQKLLRKEEEK